MGIDYSLLFKFLSVLKLLLLPLLLLWFGDRGKNYVQVILYYVWLAFVVSATGQQGSVWPGFAHEVKLVHLTS